MQIQNVASITNGAADFNFNGSGTAPLTLSGGTFNGGSGSLTFGSTFTQTGGSFTVGNGNVSVIAAFVQSGGVFTGSGSTLDFQNNFTVSGGTFTASSGNTFMANGFSVNNAIFQPNGGTVIFTGTSNTNFNVLPDGVLALNNVEVNKSSDTAGLAVGSNDTMQVNGTFTLTNGRIIGAAGGTPQANGNLIVASTFDGGDGRMAFGGANVQSYTNNGGILPTGSWTVNKTGGTVNLLSDLDISNGTQNFTLTEGTITTGTNTVIAGTRNIFNTNGFIIGGLQRTYATAGSRQFFVGTANGFAPATINATAGTFGATTTFTVRANNGTLTGASPTNSLTRNWTLEPGAGGITTANLTFQYLETDLPGGANETGFSFLRRNGGMTTNQGFTTQNTTTNVFTLDGVTNFSDWTLGTLAPTAANVSVGGRVLTDTGRGIPRARLTLTDSNGNTRTTMTNPFGYYRFDNVEVGQNYIVSVASKSYEFANPTQVVSVLENVTNVDFIALNQSATGKKAKINGSLKDGKGNVLANTRVEISGGSFKDSLTIQTDESGNFVFEDLEINATFIINIRHKYLVFTPQVIFVSEDIEGFDLTPQM
ncbi:MAG: carboxypeptidase regulatory-like domain-containing protein [Acidobacteria bacterium]|nr:carboxypeptidase regulatory-like domain-containing protein [Acidobacteriota bacterium]